MAFVQVDGSGSVVGVFACQQPGISTEVSDTDTRLAAFLNRQIIPQKVSAFIASGCVISSSTMTVLNTTWALDDTTMSEIGSVARDSAAGLGLPLGASTFSYPDKSGAMVSMTGPQIEALYKALRDYIAQMTGFVSGRSQSAPDQPYEIP